MNNNILKHEKPSYFVILYPDFEGGLLEDFSTLLPRNLFLSTSPCRAYASKLFHNKNDDVQTFNSLKREEKGEKSWKGQTEKSVKEHIFSCNIKK